MLQSGGLTFGFTSNSIGCFKNSVSIEQKCEKLRLKLQHFKVPDLGRLFHLKEINPQGCGQGMFTTEWLLKCQQNWIGTGFVLCSIGNEFYGTQRQQYNCISNFHLRTIEFIFNTTPYHYQYQSTTSEISIAILWICLGHNVWTWSRNLNFSIETENLASWLNSKKNKKLIHDPGAHETAIICYFSETNFFQIECTAFFSSLFCFFIVTISCGFYSTDFEHVVQFSKFFFHIVLFF